MRRFLAPLALGAALWVAGPLAAQPAPAATPAPPGATAESRAVAVELLTVIGSAQQAEQMMVQVSQQISAALAQASGKPAAEVLKVIDEVLMPEFRARIPEMMAFTAELWATQMTADELRQLKAFYATPLGVRLQQVTPAVALQSAAFGMRWGQDVAASALAKHRDTLRARGLKI